MNSLNVFYKFELRHILTFILFWSSYLEYVTYGLQDVPLRLFNSFLLRCLKYTINEIGNRFEPRTFPLH
jgi:hypothetical protein